MKQEDKKFLKDVFTLAIPMGLQQVINLCVNLIDNIMIGSLGEAAITAVSVCGTYGWLSMTITNGLSNGAIVLAAQDYGNNNLKRIKKLFSLVITMAVCSGLFFFLFTSFFPVQILKFYSNVPEIIEPGCGYLKYIKWTYPISAISFSIILILRSVRSVKLGFYNSLFSCFSNVFFNWVFIYGNLGAPAMGAAGAAIGTLIARIIELCVSVTYLLFIEKNLQFKLTDYSLGLSKSYIFNYFKVMIPLLIIDVLGNLVSTAQTMISGRISAYYVAANSIVHMSWNIPSVFAFGVGMSASIMIGNSLGENNFQKAKEDAHRYLITSIFLGLFCGSMVQVILPILSNFYNVTNETLILARQMGYAASVAIVFTMINMCVCNGVIKAGGMSQQLLRVDLFGNWCIAIPLGIICAFVLHMPCWVLYFVLRLGNVVKVIWGTYRLKKGDWMQNLSQTA